jgi:hypothetical protein
MEIVRVRISVFRDDSKKKGRVFAGLCEHIGYNFGGCDCLCESAEFAKVGSPSSGCPISRLSCWEREFEGDDLLDLIEMMDEDDQKSFIELIRTMSTG